MLIFNYKLFPVLRELGYVDEHNMVTLKGKVACGVTHMELLITEMLFENILSSLGCSEIAAVLSCTTCQVKDKDGDAKTNNETLRNLQLKVKSFVERIQAVERYFGVCDEHWAEQVSYKLMDVAYEWARGMPFIQIAQMTDVQEGIIVRCIQRLDEVCRNVRGSAITIGDPTLRAKMDDTSAAVRRDIVFAASLYTI